MITSENNVKLKEMIKLQKNARHRKKEGLFVAEGIKLVQEAAQYGKLRQVLIRESLWITKWQEKPENEIAAEFSGNERHVGVDVVPDDLFDQVADTVTPQGTLGMVDMPVYSLEEILNSRSRLYLMLDDLRDPGNLGTMIRTSEAAGVAGVIMSKGTDGSDFPCSIYICRQSAGNNHADEKKRNFCLRNDSGGEHGL